MELALYHPEFGYYNQRKDHYPAGLRGDFLTAPTAHGTFAATLAGLLRTLAQERGRPLTLVEVGAGDGTLLRQLVAADGWVAVERVVAVEVSARGRELLEALAPPVEVVTHWREAPPPSGPCVVFASELYDALPFHVVQGGRAGLEELFVVVDPGGRLRWQAGPPSTAELERYLKRYQVQLETGQRAEVRLQAYEFHRHLLAWAGGDVLVLVVDYGYPAQSLYNPRGRRHGSLAGYLGHRVVDPLAYPGEADITAHVNWDDLLRAGASLGFASGTVEPLGLFLARWGLVEQSTRGHEEEAGIPWQVRALLHPAGMGSDLKLLTQGKGELWQCWQEAEAKRRP